MPAAPTRRPKFRWYFYLPLTLTYLFLLFALPYVIRLAPMPVLPPVLLVLAGCVWVFVRFSNSRGESGKKFSLLFLLFSGVWVALSFAKIPAPDGEEAFLRPSGNCQSVLVDWILTPTIGKIFPPLSYNTAVFDDICRLNALADKLKSSPQDLCQDDSTKSPVACITSLFQKMFEQAPLTLSGQVTAFAVIIAAYSENEKRFPASSATSQSEKNEAIAFASVEMIEGFEAITKGIEKIKTYHEITGAPKDGAISRFVDVTIMRILRAGIRKHMPKFLEGMSKVAPVLYTANRSPAAATYAERYERTTTNLKNTLASFPD